MGKYSDNDLEKIKPEFVGPNGEQFAIKPQNDDKIYKYVKDVTSIRKMVNILTIEEFIKIKK